MSFRQPWVNPGYVLCWVDYSHPQLQGLATSPVSQVHLQWAQCPGNVVKQRVIFAEAHDGMYLALC